MRSEDDGGVCQRGLEGGKSSGSQMSMDDVEHEDIAIRDDSAKTEKGARRKIAESRLYIQTWA